MVIRFALFVIEHIHCVFILFCFVLHSMPNIDHWLDDQLYCYFVYFFIKLKLNIFCHLFFRMTLSSIGLIVVFTIELIHTQLSIWCTFITTIYIYIHVVPFNPANLFNFYFIKLEIHKKYIKCLGVISFHSLLVFFYFIFWFRAIFSNEFRIETWDFCKHFIQVKWIMS